MERKEIYLEISKMFAHLAKCENEVVESKPVESKPVETELPDTSNMTFFEREWGLMDMLKVQYGLNKHYPKPAIRVGKLLSIWHNLIDKDTKESLTPECISARNVYINGRTRALKTHLGKLMKTEESEDVIHAMNWCKLELERYEAEKAKGLQDTESKKPVTIDVKPTAKQVDPAPATIAPATEVTTETTTEPTPTPVTIAPAPPPPAEVDPINAGAPEGYRMVGDITYQAYIDAGWTDDGLITNGHLIKV